jgi:hypothetical protein
VAILRPTNFAAAAAKDPRLLTFQEGVEAGKYQWSDPQGRNVDFQRYLQDELNANPQFDVGKGYDVQNGQVQRERGNFLERNGWVLPLLAGGAMGGIGLAGALAGGGAAAAGGGASAFPAIATGPGAAGIAGATTVPATIGGASAAIAPTAASATGGTGILSKLTKAGNVAQNAGTILGGAAAARAQGQDANTRAMLERERLRQAAPGRILGDVKRASGLAAGPVKAAFGAEGSGYGGKGQRISFQGGVNEGLTPERRAALQPAIDAQISELLNPRLDQDEFTPARSTWQDKLLGGAALGTGLLGAFGKPTIRKEVV